MTFLGLSNDATLMQIQSSRTVPLMSRELREQESGQHPEGQA